MRNTLFLLSSLTLLTCAPGVPLRADTPTPVVAESYESRPVGRIEIKMENLPAEASFDPKPVLVKLSTKVGDPFSQLVFDTDLKTLSEEYDRIEPSLEVVNGEIYITIRVWARPKISKIVWKGNENFSAKTLQKELGIKENRVFNIFQFNKAFNQVKEYYLKKGYFESQLSYTLVPDPKNNTVQIDITVQEGRAGMIDEIVFKGFTQKEKSKILDMIHTKTYNFLTSWITGRGIYSEEALEQDKLTISNLLQNRGYADAKVDIQIAEAQKKGKIKLIVTVERGELYHFGKISFKGNTLFSNEEIEKNMLVHTKDTYSPEKLRETVQALKDLYGRKGYIETSIQYEAIPAHDEPIYNVEFSIEEGEQFKIGLIRVFGNIQTETHVILRESLLVPGETFDSAKLKVTQQRLESIGYFKNVNVYAVRAQDDQTLGPNYRDVYIEVEETTTGHVSLFFGASRGEGVFGGLDLSETNFNYKGFGRLFKDGPSAMRGGGEYAHAKATIGSKQRNYTISWVTPYYRDTLWRVGFDGFLSLNDLVAKRYDNKSAGGSAFASYPLNPYWSFGTKYRFKNQQTHVSKKAPDKEKQLRQDNGNVSAVSTSLNFDSTDNMLKPHNGFRSLMEIEYAGVFGNFCFFKYTYANSYYKRPWRRGTFKTRWDFRFIQPLGWSPHSENIPTAERFYIGGINSVRGYKDYDLGEHFSDNDPKGGTSSSILSLEYQHEVFSMLDLFTFIDAGSIKLKRFHLSQYKWSWGVGARIEILNRVPVILGVGFPINPDNKSEVRKFFFSMGGQF